MALADFGGVYGAPRFFQAARKASLRPIVGARIDVATPADDASDGEIERLTLLARTREGYRNLCRLITIGHAGRPKGICVVPIEAIESHAAGLIALLRPAHSPALALRASAGYVTPLPPEGIRVLIESPLFPPW